VCDNSWDNIPIISKRIKVLPEDVTIHSCYGKKLSIIEKVCSSNMKHIIRRSLIKDKEIENIYEILKYIDICLVFTNFSESNNLSSIVTEICIDNNIPIFTFNNQTTDYTYNLNKTDIKFNKYIRTYSVVPKPRDIKIIKKFNYENNNVMNPLSIDEVIEKLRRNYESIEADKKNNSIIKIDCKSSKEYSYLEYMNNKKKWLKSMNTNR
jgi:hypothetical protein